LVNLLTYVFGHRTRAAWYQARVFLMFVSGLV